MHCRDCLCGLESGALGLAKDCDLIVHLVYRDCNEDLNPGDLGLAKALL